MFVVLLAVYIIFFDTFLSKKQISVPISHNQRERNICSRCENSIQSFPDIIPVRINVAHCEIAYTK